MNDKTTPVTLRPRVNYFTTVTVDLALQLADREIGIVGTVKANCQAGLPDSLKGKPISLIRVIMCVFLSQKVSLKGKGHEKFFSFIST